MRVQPELTFGIDSRRWGRKGFELVIARREIGGRLYVGGSAQTVRSAPAARTVRETGGMGRGRCSWRACGSMPKWTELSSQTAQEVTHAAGKLGDLEACPRTNQGLMPNGGSSGGLDQEARSWCLSWRWSRHWGSGSADGSRRSAALVGADGCTRLDDGLAVAETNGQAGPRVFFTADWCPPCRRLKQGVFARSVRS